MTVLDVGERAPDFELPSTSGGNFRLSEAVRSGPVVIFFYPKAFTPGCTKESCHFRDVAAAYKEVGAQRIGISADSLERQKAFVERYKLDYPMCSDKDRAVARLYGVKRPGPLFNRRATFVIDTEMKVIAVIQSELEMNLHADRALEVLQTRKAAEQDGTGPTIPKARPYSDPRNDPTAGGPDAD
jgi:peroxiredoxin Q/BCP